MGNAKYVDYAQLETALDSLGKNLTAIQTALSDKIVVTSYEGSAQQDVERAIDSIRVNLQAIEDPLKKMQNDINDVRAKYAEREAQISSSLSGIGRNNGNIIDMEM